MRKIKEILRHKWGLGLGFRDVARRLEVSLGAVWLAVERATEAGLDLATVEAMDDAALEAKLYRRTAEPDRVRPAPDCVRIDLERRRMGVTLALLHLEYLEENPDGYGYTQFCGYYRRWLGRKRLSMRQIYRAGEKGFVDYSGKRPSITNPETGERQAVELFVAVLGASSFTYAEATATQRSQDFIASHVRAIEYWGGSPALFVPDQLRTGVTGPHRYEPEIQRTYEEMAQHYGTSVLPARPRSPRDKPKVEVAVQVAQRWILARLRNEAFFSLAALNERISELLEEMNDRVMRRYGKSRRQLFAELDKPALRPLPAQRFVWGEWKKAGVNIDYHVEIAHHYYSVPFTLVGERVEVRTTATTVEIFYKSRRVTSHPRSYARGGFSTNPEHMPKIHRDHAEWTPTRMIRWAENVGPRTAELVTAIIQDKPHPEHGYRACLGILRLGRRHGDARLEAACARAVVVRARTVRSVESILKNGLDRLPLPPSPTDPEPPRPTVQHENIRGPEYYQT